MAIPLVTRQFGGEVTGYQKKLTISYNNFIYSPVNIKYRNQIQLSEYISCTRGLTYLQGGSRVSVSSRISSQDFEQGRMSTFSLLSSRNFESGISSHPQDLSSISSQDFESSFVGFRRSRRGRLLIPSLAGAL